MVKLSAVEGTKVMVEVQVDISGTMLEAEERIQSALNDAGMMITKETLKKFDADGSAVMTGSIKWTSKGQVEKIYQTPYGPVALERHVYQTNAGGKTFCPLDCAARIVVSSTPRFARMVSHKIAHTVTTVVQQDLAENHGRPVSRGLVHDIAEAVGSIAQAKEEGWQYETPKMDSQVASVAIGMDGTCMFIGKEGWREAMTGTIALYDAKGERQHTIYIGATPEYGKATFTHRMEQEIAHVKQLYPRATFVGIADGAKVNWDFLQQHTAIQILDFWHVTQYLAEVAQAVFPNSEADRTQWLEQRCHDLKHKTGAAGRILKEMEAFPQHKRPLAAQQSITSAITYFRSHKHQMNYARYQQRALPIGSGVTEAACKTLIKHRLCASGMRWLERGASLILSLRALVLTNERWNQFWNKVDQYGFSMA